MATVDLASFEIDCSRKEEQIRMLESMRTKSDDKFLAWMSNASQPWTMVSDREQYQLREDIGRNMTNWQINHILRKFRYC